MTTAPPTKPDRRSPACDTSTQCGWCGGAMRQEHAHYRCVQCGRRDSCCDGVY